MCDTKNRKHDWGRWRPIAAKFGSHYNKRRCRRCGTVQKRVS